MHYVSFRGMTLSTLRCLLLMLAALLLPAALLGQNSSFTGKVTDPTGAVIAKAQITVRNQSTGVEVYSTTTNSGVYSVPYLVAGTYSLTVEAPGFEKVIKTEVDLQVSQVAVKDFTLQVGAVTQSVTVVDNAADLDHGKADRGEVVENARITELPLNGRTPSMLARLNSAVIWDGNLIWMRPFDGQTYTNLHINGSDPGGGANYSTEVMLDGAPNQTYRPQDAGHTDVSYVAPDDAVQEFKIVTNPYDSQYGRNRGGVIDLTLKSGTNKIHGDLYEYARRTWLDSNWWINDFIIATQKCGPTPSSPGCKPYVRPQHKLDQYGFELDGPVVLPRLFNGRNKSFFLIQFENWDEISPGTNQTSVPDPNWANGDFSGLTYNSNPVTIYNPYDTYTDAKGNVMRRPFQGNKIPAGMMNPFAVNLLKYWPKPNTTGPTTPWQNNYVYQTPQKNNYRNALMKWDYNFSAKDRFWIRYGYWERYETVNSNGVSGWAMHGEDPLGDRSHTFATQWTHQITPLLLADFRASVNAKDELAYKDPQGFDMTSLGWSSAMVGQVGPFGQFPGIAPSGFTTLGGAGNGETVTDSLTVFPSVLWQKGNHTIHAGIDLRFFRYAVTLNGSTNVGVNFDQKWTQSCAQCSAGNNLGGTDSNTEGMSIASMLLGLTSSGTVTIAPQKYWSQPYYAPYIQDDWRFNKKLVLNLGLRWDVQSAPVERHNRGSYQFDTTTTSPLDSMLPTHTLANGWTFHPVGGVTFLGANGNPRGNYATNWRDIQPRIGFAYTMTNNIVLRGGFGEMFQSNLDQFPSDPGFSASTTTVSTLDGGNTPIPGPQAGSYGGNLGNPFPTVVQPSGSSLGLLTQVGGGPSFQNAHYESANFMTYSFGIEHQLSKNDTLEISYVGTYAPNRYISMNINHWNSGPGMANIEAQCDVQRGGSHHICDDNIATNPKAILGLMPNPYYQIAPFLGQNSYYSSTTIKGLSFTQQMSQFGGITEWGYQGAKARYDSLQVNALHKWSNDLTLHATWTWSKLMHYGGWADNNYMVLNRYVDESDRPHNITISGVYNLPVGRSRKFLGNANRIVDAGLGGWEIAALSLVTAGTPWRFSGWDYVHNAKLTKPYWVTAAQVAQNKYLGLGNLQWVEPCYYNTDAETGAISPTPAAAAYGCTQPDFIQIPNYGVQPNISYTGIRQPWGYFLDSNLSKNFTITEGSKLQFRLECFNVLNHPTWQNGYYGNGTYAGEVGSATGSGQSNKPRYVQVAIKYVW